MLAVFYLLQISTAINYKTCMENVNETVEQYIQEYNIYLERKYTWINEIADSYKEKLPLLPGYDPNNPQLCDAFEYTYEVFKRCGGIMIDDYTYKPTFQSFSNDEDICNWLVVDGTEFYAETSRNKQVKIECDFNVGLDSYNSQHGLCWKENNGIR